VARKREHRRPGKASTTENIKWLVMLALMQMVGHEGVALLAHPGKGLW
jgi:hypothetical protein